MPATLQSRRMPQLFSALRLLDRHTVMKSALAVDEAVDLILCDPGDRLAGEICIEFKAVAARRVTR